MALRVLYILVCAPWAATITITQQDLSDLCPYLEVPLSDKWAPPKNPATQIVNGQDALLGQFPHQAFVYSDEQLVCGGSLVSRRAVLTAAHCVWGFKSFYIRVGGIHLAEKETTSWTAVSTWAKIHPEYNSSGFYNNDLSIVFLPKIAPLNKYINLVTFPTHAEANDSFTGYDAIVSGWGLTADNATCSEVLQWTELTVVSHRQCWMYYFHPNTILNTTICASRRNSDICSGDSGSALVLKIPGGYKQIGVASFGSPAGCHTLVPSAFARVTSFLGWISRTADIHIP